MGSSTQLDWLLCFSDGHHEALKSVRENFRRPYGARDDLPLFPALKAPGYYQTPLRGANAACSFHLVVRNLVLTHTLKSHFSRKERARNGEHYGVGTEGLLRSSNELTSLPGQPSLEVVLCRAQPTSGGVTASTEMLAAKRHAGVHTPVIACKMIIANQQMAYAA